VYKSSESLGQWGAIATAVTKVFGTILTASQRKKEREQLAKQHEAEMEAAREAKQIAAQEVRNVHQARMAEIDLQREALRMQREEQEAFRREDEARREAEAAERMAAIEAERQLLQMPGAGLPPIVWVLIVTGVLGSGVAITALALRKPKK
jgi:hypothetical protein